MNIDFDSEYAYMENPLCGNVNVQPQQEILIKFKHKQADINDVYVKINGKLIVKKGVLDEEYILVRAHKNKGFIRYGIRHKTGLPQTSIFVQAWCSKECRTINEVFFVYGTSKEIEKPKTKQKTFKCKGGFVTSDTAHVYESGVLLDENGAIRVTNTKDNSIDHAYLPEGFRTENIHAGANRNNWVVLSSSNQSSLMIRSDLKTGKYYDFPMESINVGRKWINARSPKSGTTYHLPFSYVPGPVDDFWFKMNFKDYKDYDNCVMNDGTHVWFTEDKMLIRHNCNPISGDCLEILWTTDDMDIQKIKTVKIVNSEHVIVNNRLLINFENPKIYRT